MANEHLKRALERAGLTVEQFAEIITVDPKTVRRWTAGRTPYPRHRATIARALDVPEHDLWPEDVSPPGGASERERSAVGDVSGSWGRSSDPAAPDPVALLTQTVERIDVLDDDGTLLQAHGLLAALRDRALVGCAVRVLTFAPPQELGALVGRDGVELRLARAWSALALVRAGDAMMLTIRFAGPGRSALLALRRRGDGGWFDRLAEHFEVLWEEAEIPADPRQLIASPLRASVAADPRRDPQSAGPRAGEEQPGPASSPVEPAPRRWPRRPD